MFSEKKMTDQKAEHEKAEHNDQWVADRFKSLRQVNHLRTCPITAQTGRISRTVGMDYSSFIETGVLRSDARLLWSARIETSNKNAVFKDALLAVA